MGRITDSTLSRMQHSNSRPTSRVPQGRGKPIRGDDGKAVQPQSSAYVGSRVLRTPTPSTTRRGDKVSPIRQEGTFRRSRSLFSMLVRVAHKSSQISEVVAHHLSACRRTPRHRVGAQKVSIWAAMKMRMVRMKLKSTTPVTIWEVNDRQIRTRRSVQHWIMDYADRIG